MTFQDNLIIFGPLIGLVFLFIAMDAATKNWRNKP